MKPDTKSSSSTKQDPRHLNKTEEASSITEYFRWYTDTLSQALSKVDTHQLERALILLREAIDSGREIFVAGNGGSAAIAEHLCCDWTKGTHVHSQKAVKTRSLVSNVAVITAFSNDFGYEHVFASQLEMFATRGDVVVLVSSSGNSPNVVAAAVMAEKLGLHTICFTGFSGGALGAMADVHVHIPFENYGIVEDGHEILMHTIGQFLTKLRERSSAASRK